MSYESTNQPSPLTPLEEAILIASTGPTGAVMHDGPIDKPDGGKRAGHAVPARHGPRGEQRRQRPGDVVLHDQRRGHLADQAPAGARGDGALPGHPAALGGPHRGRLARVRRRRQAQGLRRAVRVPARVAVLPRLERAALERAGHDVLPAGRRQHAPVHQRAADPALGVDGQGAAVHRRLAAVPAARRGRVGGVGWRRSSGSWSRSPTSRSAASSGRATASTPRTCRRRWAASARCAPSTRRTS